MAVKEEAKKIVEALQPVDKTGIADKIANTLKSSPANTPTLSTEKMQTMERNRQNKAAALSIANAVYEPPVVNLGSELSGLASAVQQQALSEIGEIPTDTSTPINMEYFDNAPTKRVATARTLSTDGATDYRQFEYGKDDTRGVSVVGAPEGGMIVGNTGTGVGSAGGVLGSSGELRPMSGVQGNPYFLREATPAIFNEVAPFDVSLPRYGLTAKSTTIDPHKLAYLLATGIQGEPVDAFVGFDRMYERRTESFWSGLSKGLRTMPVDLLSGVFKGAGYVANTAMTAPLMAGSAINDLFGLNANTDWIDSEVNNINEATGELLSYIDKAQRSYTEFQDAELTSGAGLGAKIGYGAPTAIGQLGLAWLAGKPNWLTSSFIFGAMQGADTWQAMDGLAISPTERNLRGIGSMASSVALNYLGGLLLMEGKLAAGRRFMANTAKRMGQAAGVSALGALTEGVTEGADAIVQDLFSMNIRDDNYSERLDNYIVSTALGLAAGLATIPMNLRAERVQIAKEAILAKKVGASSTELEKKMRDFAEAVERTGLMGKAEAIDLLFLMSLPNAQKALNDATKKTIDAIYDRVDPNKLKDLLSRGSEAAKQTMEDFKKLDAQVMSALPKDMDGASKIMTTRLMRGVASVLAIYGGQDIKIPTFKYRAGVSEYDPKTNTLYISRNPSARTVADDFVRDSSLQRIDPEQRSLLHEIGHMLDVQLGQNTNFRDFLPAYFDAIAKVFGKKRAEAVQSAMPKSGKRVGNVKKDTEYMSDKNTTEWFAYSLGRLGKNVAEAVGLKGDVAHYVDVANVVANQALIPEMQNALKAYNDMLKELITSNDETLIAMAKAAGEKGLADAIERFVAGDDNALSKDDVQALYKILKSYVGFEGGKILSEAFANVSTETFMERTEREFREAIKPARTPKKVQGVELEDFGGEDGYTPKDALALQERPSTDNMLFELPSMQKLSQTPAVRLLEAGSKNRSLSNLERRMKAHDSLPKMSETTKRIDDILSAPDYKPVSKFYTKVFGGFQAADINSYLWMISPDLRDEFDLVTDFATADAKAIDVMSEFWIDTGMTNAHQRNVFMNKLNQPSIAVTNYVGEIIGNGTTTWTPNQALGLYLEMKTKNQEHALAAFNGDEQAIQNIINQLTPEQKAFGDSMQEFLRKKYLRRKLYTAEELMDLTDEEMDALGLEEGFDVQEFLDRQDEGSLYWPRLSMKYALRGDRRPNYDISRKEAPDDPSSFDVPATETFSGYIYRQATGETGVYSKIRRLKDVLFYDPRDEKDNLDEKAKKKSEELTKSSDMLRAKLLKAFHGDKRRVANFNNLLNDYLEGAYAQDVGSSILDKVMRSHITGQISWKLLQFPKNLSNLFMFFGLADNQAEYWLDTAWAATHWNEAKEYMMSRIPELKVRYGGAGIDEQMRQNTSASDNLLMTFASNKQLPPQMQNAVANIVAVSQMAKKAGFFPMMAGDAASNIIGGYGVLKQYINKYGEEEGIKRLTRDIASRQSTSNRALKSLMQREWGRDFRGQFIAFATELLNKTKTFFQAIERAKRGEISWADAGKDMAAISLSLALYSLIAAGVYDLFDDNEKNDEEVFNSLKMELVSTVTGFTPLGGSIIAPIVAGVFMDTQPTMSTPFISGVNNAFDAMTDKDWAEASAIALGMSGTLIGAGVLEEMAEGGIRGLTSEDEKAESGWRMLVGESETRAEKRAGYKEPVEKEDQE